MPDLQPTLPKSSGTAIRLTGVNRRWGDAVALDAVSLTVAAGSFIALLNRSGCGKIPACASSPGWRSRAKAGLPLLLAFLLFQRQFVQSFMRAGIR